MFFIVFDANDDFLAAIEADGWRHVDEILNRLDTDRPAALVLEYDEAEDGPWYVKRFKIEDILDWELYKTTLNYAMTDVACQQAKEETGKEYVVLYVYMDGDEFVYILEEDPNEEVFESGGGSVSSNKENEDEAGTAMLYE